MILRVLIIATFTFTFWPKSDHLAFRSIANTKEKKRSFKVKRYGSFYSTEEKRYVSVDEHGHISMYDRGEFFKSSKEIGRRMDYALEKLTEKSLEENSKIQANLVHRYAYELVHFSLQFNLKISDVVQKFSEGRHFSGWLTFFKSSSSHFIFRKLVASDAVSVVDFFKLSQIYDVKQSKIDRLIKDFSRLFLGLDFDEINYLQQFYESNFFKDGAALNGLDFTKLKEIKAKVEKNLVDLKEVFHFKEKDFIKYLIGFCDYSLRYNIDAKSMFNDIKNFHLPKDFQDKNATVLKMLKRKYEGKKVLLATKDSFDILKTIFYTSFRDSIDQQNDFLETHSLANINTPESRVRYLKVREELFKKNANELARFLEDFSLTNQIGHEKIIEYLIDSEIIVDKKFSDLDVSKIKREFTLYTQGNLKRSKKLMEQLESEKNFKLSGNYAHLSGIAKRDVFIDICLAHKVEIKEAIERYNEINDKFRWDGILKLHFKLKEPISTIEENVRRIESAIEMVISKSNSSFTEHAHRVEFIEELYIFMHKHNLEIEDIFKLLNDLDIDDSSDLRGIFSRVLELAQFNRGMDYMSQYKDDASFVFNVFEKNTHGRDVFSHDFIEALREQDNKLDPNRVMNFKFFDEQGKYVGFVGLYDGMRVENEKKINSKLPIERKYKDIQLEERIKGRRIIEIRRLAVDENTKHLGVKEVSTEIANFLKMNKLDDAILYVNSDFFGSELFRIRAGMTVINRDAPLNGGEYILKVEAKKYIQRFSNIKSSSSKSVSLPVTCIGKRVKFLKETNSR